MDSLDLVELLMDVEARFGVEIPEEALPALRTGTVGDLWRLIVRLKTGAEPARARPAAGDPVWQELRAWIARVGGLPPDDVTPERRLDG